MVMKYPFSFYFFSCFACPCSSIFINGWIHFWRCCLYLFMFQNEQHKMCFLTSSITETEKMLTKRRALNFRKLNLWQICPCDLVTCFPVPYTAGSFTFFRLTGWPLAPNIRALKAALSHLASCRKPRTERSTQIYSRLTCLMRNTLIAKLLASAKHCLDFMRRNVVVLVTSDLSFSTYRSLFKVA